MIRGAIEIAEPARVVGWIVSSATSLRGQTVLAFSGVQCVGAGAVNVFRQDLLMADLRDGHAGFDFPIALSSDQDIASVVIRLEHCDAAILQAGCEVVLAEPVRVLNRPRPRPGAGNAALVGVAASHA